MQFDNWQAFLQMGGYGFYVWASIGLSLFVLAIIMLVPVWHYRKLLKQQQRIERYAERLPQSEL